MDWKTVILTLSSTIVLILPCPAQSRPKIYISADMEGVAGVVTGEQLGPSGFEYQRFREFMTDEVLAAIEGARAGGAGEVLVSDSHGNGQNLLIERFPPDVQIVRAWPRPLGMMQGIDASFAGVICIGYHTGTTDLEGVRAHTMSSARLTDIRLNGVSMPELGINAAIAGEYGVPVVMVSGDDAIVAKAFSLLGPVEGTTVKWAYGFHSARTLAPLAARQLIRQKAEEAVRQLAMFRPYRLGAPIQLEVQFKNYRASEILAYLSIVDRIDSHAIRFTGQGMTEISKFLQFLGHYEPGIAP